MRRRALTLLALSLPFAAGRGVMAASAVETLNGAGVTFVVPNGWATEDDADGKALFMYLMAAPNAVVASMMIEIFTDERPQSSERSVDALLRSRKAKRPSYRELKRGIRSTATGLGYAFAQFEVYHGGAPFLEQYVVVPVAGSTRVNVFSSFDANFSSRFLPIVERFVESLRVTS